jgi:hypothetical protein
LLLQPDSLRFSHVVMAKLPIVRRLAKGYIEEGKQAEYAWTCS